MVKPRPAGVCAGVGGLKGFCLWPVGVAVGPLGAEGRVPRRRPPDVTPLRGPPAAALELGWPIEGIMSIEGVEVRVAGCDVVAAMME